MLKLTRAFFGTIAACSVAMPAFAVPVVDGTITAGEYGAGPTAVTVYTPGAPNGNFGNPSPATDVGYSIYQTSTNGFYYGAVQVNSAPNGIVGTFANLYFDLDPANNNGSDLGFEIGLNGQNAFIPGVGSPQPISGLTVKSGNGGNTLEFSIPISDFTTPIAGLSYAPGQVFPSAGDQITLRLSQSFGYSVAGGAAYGPNRLGAVTLVATTAVPEPASFAVLGLGLLGLGAIRRKRRSGEAAATA